MCVIFISGSGGTDNTRISLKTLALRVLIAR